MKNKNLLKTIIVAVAVGAVGFFGGIYYQKGKIQNFRGNSQFPTGSGVPNTMNTRQGNTGGMQPVLGEITSKDDTSITVKTQNSSSKIVILSSTTTISKTSEGSLDDLTNGVNVTVIGTSNSDGSITAQTISVGSNFPGLNGPSDQPVQD